MMPAIMLIVLGLAMAGGAIVLVYASRSAPPGAPAPSVPSIEDRMVVTITGTVVIIGEPLISPLSARRCVLFESYANLYETVDGEKRALVAQLAKRAMVPFGLETSMGVIVVDGTEADLELQPTPVFPRRIERELAFLREHDRSEQLVETTTFEELSVDPESLVSVRGMARVEGEPSKIRLVAHGEELPLLIGVPRRAPVITH